MRSTGTPQKLTILVAEDNPGDLVIMRRAFRESGIPVILHVVNDGEQALDFLLQRGKFSEAPRPDAVFLDLNLPRKSGLDILYAAKVTTALIDIPFVVVSSSVDSLEAERNSSHRGAAYVKKSLALDDYLCGLREALQVVHAETHFPYQQAIC